MLLCGRGGLGSALSSRKPSLSSSCRMARLASCSMSLKVSLMLRNMEKKSSWSRVSTRMLSGKSSVAFFSSRVTSTHCTTRLTGHQRGQTHHQVKPAGGLGRQAPDSCLALEPMWGSGQHLLPARSPPPGPMPEPSYAGTPAPRGGTGPSWANPVPSPENLLGLPTKWLKDEMNEQTEVS